MIRGHSVSSTLGASTTASHLATSPSRDTKCGSSICVRGFVGEVVDIQILFSSRIGLYVPVEN